MRFVALSQVVMDDTTHYQTSSLLKKDVFIRRSATAGHSQLRPSSAVDTAVPLLPLRPSIFLPPDAAADTVLYGYLIAEPQAQY